MRQYRGVCLWVAVVAGTGLALGMEPVATRTQLGREVKFRILVDKVMQPVAKWTTEEWMIRETAEAGFNVYSPRHGFADMNAVRQVTEWCRTYGIYHMIWMRGTLNAPEGTQSDGKRVVTANGNEQLLWSVNSDEFWEWTTRYIEQYARISAENPHLIGVFLDYENYAKGKQGNLYSLGYDDVILEAFAKAQGVELPELELGARAPWLKRQGLHDAFEEFQVAHWRERCRTLRERVDAIGPMFQFCLYPAPGTPFMVRACYPEWATEKAPLILGDASTYSRPSRFMSQARSLKENRDRLVSRSAVPREAGIPFFYTGGLDPVVKGADPEFCGKNALVCSATTDGYWVFYEGPRYKVDHPHYFRWFTWANKAMDEGRMDAWQEPRVEEEGWSLELIRKNSGGPLHAPPVTGEDVSYSTAAQFRGDHLFVLNCKADQAVRIKLQTSPVGRDKNALTWEVRDTLWEEVASGEVGSGKEGTAQFTPTADGLHLLRLSAGRSAYRIQGADVPIGAMADGKLGTIGGARRLYLPGPPSTVPFKLSVNGWGAETVRLNVHDPQDNTIASGQTTLSERRVTVEIKTWTPGEVYAIELTKADEGVLEDAQLYLDKGMLPILSLHPDQVFR
ncbi:MAG: hypothetical protein HN742_29820 [Lentisphaerae bacterium]|nr:hypothetical protein [Lentisphaerota bacterium]MBT5608302.1 hypothetical protein [Lentisphaerota bacterium]MBT7061798.1 hypothetical protein [Lentisphaerota bacterium]MBT7846107.1 hypothetical protein [Lentisphaerota bacterium]